MWLQIQNAVTCDCRDILNIATNSLETPNFKSQSCYIMSEKRFSMNIHFRMLEKGLTQIKNSFASRYDIAVEMVYFNANF